jgi:hypothetical protein
MLQAVYSATSDNYRLILGPEDYLELRQILTWIASISWNEKAIFEHQREDNATGTQADLCVMAYELSVYLLV